MINEAIIKEPFLEDLYSIIFGRRLKKTPRIPANVNVNIIGR